MRKTCAFWLIAILTILNIPSAKAEVFTVTSKADAGVGSLREALTKAAINGFVQKDSILFNLPGNTYQDMTIEILSKLPEMTSNLVIDGTSQPGAGFGSGFAKVRLEVTNMPQLNDPNNYHYILEANKAEDISIFGMVFYFSKWTIFTTNERCSGLKFFECKKVQIGAAGKGNIFKGMTIAIAAHSSSPTFNYDPKTEGLIIQGNMVGYTENGDLAYVTLDYFNYAEYFVSCSNTANILIGGDKLEDGNIVNASKLEIHDINIIDSGLIKISNNSFSVSSRRNPGLDSSQGSTHIKIQNQHQPVFIEKNIINGLVELNKIYKPFHIKGNIILNGFDSRSIFASRTLIAISQCSEGGLIGGDGPDDPNELTSYYFSTVDKPVSGSAGNAIVTQDIYGQNISILKNKIHCVNASDGGIAAFWGSSISLDPLPPSFVRILDQTPTLVTGKATPNSRIDIYYDDDCTACEGEIHLGTTTSAADSSWQFSGNFIKTVLATATNSKGATSEFTQPRFGNNEVKITHTRCNSNIGSIKGIKLYGNWDEVLWFKYEFNSQDGTVKMIPFATTLDIENLSEGIYYLRVRYRNTCMAPMGEFRIYNYEYYINDNAAIIKQPACKQASGAISQVYVGSGNGYYTDAIKYWEDDQGKRYKDEELSMAFASISKLKPGKYRLILQDTVGLCSDTSRWFTLVDQPGASINEGNVSVKNASCNLPNGAITGMQVNNSSNNQIFFWLDSVQNIIGNQIDLTGVALGKYRMAYWDDGGCDTLYSNWYVVGASGAILVDASKVITAASQCIRPTGSIKGIVANGNFLYQWLDVTGNSVSQTLDPGLLFPGKYMLRISSAQGCDSMLGPFEVSTVPTFDYIPKLEFAFTPSTCGENNGSVTILNHPALNGYSYRWVANSNGSGPVLSSNFTLSNMTVGSTYYFYLKDSKGCEQLGTSALNTVQFPKPVLNENTLLISPATCLAGGSISGLGITQTPAAAPYKLVWRNQAGDSITNSIGISNVSPGNYALQVRDNFGCSITKTFVITSAITNLPAPLYDAVRVKRGSGATILVKNYQTGGIYTLFVANSATVAIQQNTTGRFTFNSVPRDTTVYIQFEKDGCSSRRVAVTISVYDEVTISIPNAFSPNNDGINDIMTISTQGIQALSELIIFDRYGKTVYKSADPQKGWNGKSNNGDLPVGTYYFVLEAIDDNQRRLTKKGSITLLR